MSSAPSLEKAFQSQKAQIIGYCDLCNQVLQKGHGKPYTADEFRALVAKGFEPPEAAIQHGLRSGGSREQFLQQWKFDLVAQSQTGWMLCPLCQEKAEKYRPEPDIHKIAGYCDLCNQVLQKGQGKPYTADEFRALVAKGFEPPEAAIQYALRSGRKREQFLQQWKLDLVAQSQTGWSLCPTCQEKTEQYRSQPEVQEKIPQVTGTGLCDVCNQSISMAEGKSFTASEIQNIVFRGFEPPDNIISMSQMFGLSRASFLEGWKRELVGQSPTEWFLCADCANRAHLYM